jgi:hypothetical protein
MMYFEDIPINPLDVGLLIVGWNVLALHPQSSCS